MAIGRYIRMVNFIAWVIKLTIKTLNRGLCATKKGYRIIYWQNFHYRLKQFVAIGIMVAVIIFYDNCHIRTNPHSVIIVGIIPENNYDRSNVLYRMKGETGEFYKFHIM